MNKFMTLVFAMATISVAAADSCTPQKAKPTFNDQEIDTDNMNQEYWKMFQGYIQEEHEGQTLYVAFNLGAIYDDSTPAEDVNGPHTWEFTLKTVCAEVDVDVIKANRHKLTYNFNGRLVNYDFGGETKSCRLTLAPSIDGHPTYNCGDAKLVVQRMNMSMYLEMDDDYVVSID